MLKLLYNARAGYCLKGTNYLVIELDGELGCMRKNCCSVLLRKNCCILLLASKAWFHREVFLLFFIKSLILIAYTQATLKLSILDVTILPQSYLIL